MEFDSMFAKFLDEQIEKKIEIVTKRILEKSGYYKSWVAVIDSVDTINHTADVTLPGDTTILSNKPYLNTVKTINVGDEVYLISPNNRLDNTVIFFNKEDL
jgi:hypothetical protein